MNASSTHDVVSTRVFEAPVAEVWRAWSEPDQVKKWWGPTGFTCPTADLDFRVGGSSLVCMRMPEEYGGLDLYNTWTYSRIVTNERIEFVLRFTDADRARADSPPDVPEEVRHVVTFTVVDRSKTELTVTEYGYGSEQARDLSKAGLEQCLDKMAAIFGQ